MTKAALLLYWIIASVVAFLYVLYKPEIDQLVKSWISRLIP